MSAITSFSIIDVDAAQAVVTRLVNGERATVELSPEGIYGIEANVEKGAGVRSVLLELSGAKNVVRTEGRAPYSLYGDKGHKRLHGENLPPGDYVLKATAYNKKRRQGHEIGHLEVSFQVQHDSQKTRFNANKATRPQDVSHYRLPKPLVLIGSTREFLGQVDCDYAEGQIDPNGLAQVATRQHQVVYSRTPTVPIDNDYLDNEFPYPKPLNGYYLREYRGEQHVYHESVEGSWNFRGANFEFTEEEPEVLTTYVRARTRMFFANWYGDAQYGGFYPGPWSEWSDVWALQRDDELASPACFRPGEPGIYRWQAAWERPEQPTERDMANENTLRSLGWSHQTVYEDIDENTPPVWCFAFLTWWEHPDKIIKEVRNGRTVSIATADESKPKRQRWQLSSVRAIDPALQAQMSQKDRAAQLAEKKRLREAWEKHARVKAEQKKQRAARKAEIESHALCRDNVGDLSADGEFCYDPSGNGLAQFKLGYDVGDPHSIGRHQPWGFTLEYIDGMAERTRKRKERKAKQDAYLAEQERQRKADQHAALIETLRWHIEPMSKAEAGSFLRAAYANDRYNAFDPAIEVVAAEMGIEL